MGQYAHTLHNAWIELILKLHKDEMYCLVASYCEGVNYLLDTYAPDDIIAEAETDMTRFTQPSNKLLTEYAKALWNKELRCDTVYDEYVLNRIFIEGFSESIHHSRH